MSREHRKQMTLGELTDALRAMDSSMPIKADAGLCSYRGYYEDLCIEPSDEGCTAGEVLKSCEDADGKVFTGYKGGDFKMDVDTPIFVAHYGSCGKPLKRVSKKGNLKTYKSIW